MTDLDPEAWEWDGIPWVDQIEHLITRLHDDARFALEVRAAKAWGVKFSKFMRWDPEDRAVALAMLIHDGRERDATCRRCGTKPSEWNDDEGRRLQPKPWQVEWVNCGGCQSILIAEEDAKADGVYEEEWVRPELKRRASDDDPGERPG